MYIYTTLNSQGLNSQLYSYILKRVEIHIIVTRERREIDTMKLFGLEIRFPLADVVVSGDQQHSAVNARSFHLMMIKITMSWIHRWDCLLESIRSIFLIQLRRRRRFFQKQ